MAKNLNPLIAKGNLLVVGAWTENESAPRGKVKIHAVGRDYYGHDTVVVRYIAEAYLSGPALAKFSEAIRGKVVPQPRQPVARAYFGGDPSEDENDLPLNDAA